MLIIIGAVIVTIAVAITRRQMRGGMNTDPLGTMSEQWLAEHRASHSE